MAASSTDPKVEVTLVEEASLPYDAEKVKEHAMLGTDDETAKYTESAGVEIDAALNRKLYWKVNRRILTFMLVTYFCQSLDKGTLGFSSIMGIKKNAHLVGQDYSWLGTILYMGILAGEYPTNFLLQKLPIAKYLAAKTTMWYTREEQSILTSLWYCMTGVQLMVGGLIAYGVSHYNKSGTGVMYSWQLLFLILGCATVMWSLCIGLFLPDSPMKAKCFTEEEKKLLIERVRHNETGIQNRKYKRYQIVEALTDPLVWCCVMLILVANLVIGGLGVFSNLIISAFGFSVLQTQLLNIAQGAITIMVMIGSATLSTKLNQTCLVMLLWTIPPIIGTAVILGVKPTSSNAGGLLIAFYCTQFFLAEGNMIISLISRNVAGQTKKGICLSMTFVGWAVGNMAAPQIFRPSDAPRYTHGFIVHMVVYAVYFGLVVVTRVLLMRRNALKRRITAVQAGTSTTDDVSHDLAFQDLTDKENPNFRYVY
ncbi:hypothetical protein MBLNU459_g4835t1 [Dothideomycetes sp. NU459]